MIREKFLATKDGKEGSDLRIKYEDSLQAVRSDMSLCRAGASDRIWRRSTRFATWSFVSRRPRPAAASDRFVTHIHMT